MITSLKLPFTFDPDRLKADLAIALHHPWIQHYNQRDYSGNWNVLSLYAPGGESSSIYASPNSHNAVEPTEVLLECSYFKEVLDVFDFEKIIVRLMRLEAGAQIKPHRDSCLGYEDGEFRLHIPLVTNVDVEFIVSGERVIMEEGSCWYFNAKEMHSVANNGTEDRIHLVIDGKRNAWTDELFFSLAPEKEFEAAPIPVKESEKAMVIAELRKHGTPGAEALIRKLLDEQ